MNKMFGAPGAWIPIRHAPAQTDPNLPDVFVTSVTGLLVPNPGGLMLVNAVGGGSGGGGGGSNGGGSTPNCGGGGGGGSGNSVYNVIIYVPPTAVTMDITIGAGGTGGAVGSNGSAGGDTYLVFKNSAGNVIGSYSVTAERCVVGGNAGLSAAAGTAVAGGSGAPAGSWLTNYTFGVSGGAGNFAPPIIFAAYGFGSVAAQAGGAGGGVTAGNVGQSGGGLSGSHSIFGNTTGSAMNSLGGSGSGSLGGGGAGGKPIWPYTHIQVNGGNGGSAGTNASTAGPGGTPAYGYGGGGGGGNAAGGNGAPGCMQLFYRA